MKSHGKRALWTVVLFLSLILSLCACDQTEPGSSTHSDSPFGSTPSVNVEVPSSSNVPPEGCDPHSYSDGIQICTACGYDYYADTLEFTPSQTGDTYIVSGVGACTARKIIIPAVYSGLPVVEIGENAFNHEENLFAEKDRITEIVLPASITKIGSQAFCNCRSLQKIVIPEGIAEIGDAAFMDCWALEDITLPLSLTKIGPSAFSSCRSLVSIEIPEGVTTIGGSAFWGCTSLKEIKLHDGITAFGEKVFQTCWSLEQLQIPAAVTDIPDEFASGCFALKNVEFLGDVVSIGQAAFQQCKVLQGLDLGNKLETIGDSAFAFCSSLTEITLPETLKHIGSGVFAKCPLKTIILPDNLESVSENNPFRCEQLQFNEYEGLGYLGSTKNPYMVLVCCLDQTIQTVSPHKDTRFICDASIEGENIKSLHIGESVEQFPIKKVLDKKQKGHHLEIALSPENKTFRIAGNCLIEIASKTLLLGFKDAVIPDDGSVTVIGRDAFAYVEGISCLIVPESVEEIGDNAFFKCMDLRYLVIGSNVKTLGHDILSYQNTLCEVYYCGTEEQWNRLRESTNKFWLNNAFETRLRYYYSETAPTESGTFWHYVDGIPTPWKSEE